MLILRTVKGSKLTWSELDGNFTYLEDEIEVVRELADGDTLVRITPQVFLPEQRDQALANIGAAPQSVINDIEARVEFLETIQPVTYDLQTPTPEMQQQLRDNAGVYSKDEVDNLVAGEVPIKQKQVYEHKLLEEDLINESLIILQLESTPDQNEWFDLHINGSLISYNSYEITEDTLSIIISEISEVSIGDNVIFRYREL